MSRSRETTSKQPSASSADGALTGVRDLSPEQRKAFERELLYGEAVEHVRALMHDLGLSQRDLAHRLKVTDARMSQILSGRENLTLRTLADLGWSSGVRFTLVAEPVDRRGTPAENDPPPPRWLARHARVVAQRVRAALSA